MRRVVAVGEYETIPPVVESVLRQVAPDGGVYWHINEVEKYRPGPDDLLVLLGKKAIEDVLKLKKIKLDQYVGQEHNTTVEGVPCKVVCQYHPGYVERLQGRKGGLMEKVTKAWYDIWDMVEELATGQDVKRPDVDAVMNYEDLLFRLDQLLEADFVTAYDYETYGENSSGENMALRPELCRIFQILTIGVAVAVGDEWSAFAFPFQWQREDGSWFWTSAQFREIESRWLKILQTKTTVAHSCKYEHKCNLRVFGQTWLSMDTQLEDDTINELNDHKLHRVGARLGLRWMSYKADSDGIRKRPKDAPLDKLLIYNALDGLCTILCHFILQAKLAEEGLVENARREEEFAYYLAKLEMAGMQIDPAEATIVRAEIAAQIPKLEQAFRAIPEVQKVEAWAGRHIKTYASVVKKGGEIVFNPKSAPMMRRLCMVELKLPVDTQRVNGKDVLKLDKRALEPFEESNPVIKALVDMRKLSAMRTGFLDKWESFVDDHSRVHSQFGLAEVVTGRLNSTNPPQQNIPKKHRIRKIYVSRYPGGWIVNADVKQQEPRLLAGWAQDSKMIEAINSGYDLHGYVASEIYSVPYMGDQTEKRDVGKRMNLGMMYGQTEYGLAAKTGMSVEEARALLARYDRRFPDIATWRLESQRFAARTGYSEDLFGRRRHLPDAKSTNKWLRERALRQASNYRIQRTAMVFTMISLAVAIQEIENKGLRDHMCVTCTVHDSLIGDADADHRDELVDILRHAVECHNESDYWGPTGVPMLADIEVGRNLYELEKVTL